MVNVFSSVEDIAALCQQCQDPFELLKVVREEHLEVLQMSGSVPADLPWWERERERSRGWGQGSLGR